MPTLDPQKVIHWRQRLQSQQQVSEVLASQFLADLDIPMVSGAEVATESQLIEAAGRLGYPLVLKTAEPGITHKSDQGGVMLNIPSQARLLEAYQHLAQRLGSAAIHTRTSSTDTSLPVSMFGR